MNRRNFLLNFLLWILFIIFGYRVGNSNIKSDGFLSEELAQSVMDVEKQAGANDDEKISNAITNVLERQTIQLKTGKTYNLTSPITTSKAFILDLNGATINYKGKGYWLTFDMIDRKNIVIKNGVFTGNEALKFENVYGFKIQDVLFWTINKYAVQYKGVLWATMENVFFRRCGLDVIRGTTGNTENNVIVFNNVEIQGNTDMTISPAINLDLVHQAEFRSFTVENLLQNSILYAKDCQQIVFDTAWFERVVAVDDNTDLITLDNCFNIAILNSNLGLSDAIQKHRYFINMINKCGTLEIKNSYGVNATEKGFINTDSDKTVVNLDNMHCTNGAITVKGGVPKISNINLKANGVVTMASLSQDGLKYDFELPWLQGVNPDIDKDFDTGETTSDTGLSGTYDTTVYLTGGRSYKVDVLAAGTQKAGMINQSLLTGAVNDTFLCLVKLKSNIPANIKMKFTGTAAFGSDQLVPVDTKWKQFALYSSPVTTAGNYYPYFTIPVQAQDFSLYIDRLIVYKLTNTGVQIIPLISGPDPRSKVLKR